MEIHPQLSSRHVEANINMREENQDNQNRTNEVYKTRILGYIYNWNEKESTY
jgi:hypothetical protein